MSSEEEGCAYSNVCGTSSQRNKQAHCWKQLLHAVTSCFALSWPPLNFFVWLLIRSSQKPLRTRAATPNVPVHLWWTVFEELAAGRRVRSNRIRKGFREILSSYLHQSQQSVCERHQTLWRKSFKASFRAPSCVLNCGWHRQWWSEILRQLNWLNSEKHVSSSS